jgi:hypothetical protein
MTGKGLKDLVLYIIGVLIALLMALFAMVWRSDDTSWDKLVGQTFEQDISWKEIAQNEE